MPSSRVTGAATVPNLSSACPSPQAMPVLPGALQHRFILFNAWSPLFFILFMGLTHRAAAGLAFAQKRRGKRLHNSFK